jgi:uncharacterized protein (DUF1697 family)
MPTWVALFRGINVGGHNVVPMQELARLLTALGLRDVSTYIQSGNVVFAAAGSAALLSRRISAAVARECGFEPQLLLLPARELARAIERNPFPEAQASPQFLHLWFLASRPAKAADRALAPLLTAGERFVLDGRVLYLHAPAGIGGSKFAARAERALAVAGTARNWRTVTALYHMTQKA